MLRRITKVESIKAFNMAIEIPNRSTAEYRPQIMARVIPFMAVGIPMGIPTVGTSMGITRVGTSLLFVAEYRPRISFL
jgi:hypothetical protein